MDNKALLLGVIISILFLGCIEPRRDIDHRKIEGDFEKLEEVADICREINSTNRRNLCLAVVYKQPHLCDNITESSDYYMMEMIRSNCLKEVAIAIKDQSICDRVKFFPYKRECYYNIAELTKNPGLCEKIGMDRYVDRCYYNIAKITKDITLCEHIRGRYDKSLKSRCSAVTKGNPQLCENIEKRYDKEECYCDVGETTRNPYFCNTFINGTNFYRCYHSKICYYNIARAEKNASICDKIMIIDRDLKVTCIAEITKNVSVCEDIPWGGDGIMLHQCYKTVAVVMNDSSICKYINSTTRLDNCFLNVAIKKSIPLTEVIDESSHQVV